MAAFAIALSPAPAMAQEAASDPDALTAIFGEAFVAKPLSAEQQANLPTAELVVDKIFPAGTYAKMMDETLKPMMDSMMGGMLDLPVEQLAKLTGLPQAELAEAGKGTLGEAMAIFDPSFRERQEISTGVTIEFITELMDRVEPTYRAGLARAYAQRFSAGELTELNRFFETPVGSHYAAESMLIYSDPQVMSAMKETMPAIFELLPGMVKKIEDRTAHLPAPRAYAELTQEERDQLAGIFGLPRENLDASAPSEDAVELDAWAE